MNKKELIETAQALGLTLTGKETVDELRALVEANNNPPENSADPKVARRKVSRGNTRRLLREAEALGKAIDAFAGNLDAHIFAVDDEGNRIGKWPVIEGVLRVKDQVMQAVQEAIQPADE